MSDPRKRLSEVEPQRGEVTAVEKKKQKVDHPQRLYHGLRNQGATDYLNSVLQILFMTAEVHDRLDPESQITDKQLSSIFEKLETRICGTENLTKSLEIKNVFEQRDAAECLELILRKVSPRVSEERGFESVFQVKSFSGNNLVYCNKCKKKRKATKGCEMVKFPQILILLLKRFDFDYNTRSHVKSDCCVDVPHTLQTENQRYKLYGMVDHMGSLRATILSNDEKTWYKFDDHHVRKVKEQPFANDTTYKSITAYLLIYRGESRPCKSRTNFWKCVGVSIVVCFVIILTIVTVIRATLNSLW